MLPRVHDCTGRWGGSGHHQVAFADPQQMATMVAKLESKLSTLHVESSITVV